MEAYSRAPRQGFIYKHKRYFSIFTSRGCPYGCIYCHKVLGWRFRGRRPERVLAEIQRLVEDYGIREIDIIDDIFNYDVERAAAILEGIIHNGWNLSLGFPNGVRGDLLDEPFIDLMARAGTFHVSIAIESGSNRIQQLIRKKLDLDRIRKNIELLVQKRIFTNVYNMIGFPTETKEEALTTVRFASGTKAHTGSFFFVNPFPGTELARRVSNRNAQTCSMEDPPNFFDPRVADFGISDIPPDQHRAIVSNAAWRFYFLHPHRLWRILRDIPNKSQLLTLPVIVLLRAFMPKILHRLEKRLLN